MVFSFSAEGQTTEIPEVTTSAPSIASQSGFLFGSASVASLSFQSVAASSLTASPFGKKTPDKSPELKGAGSQLFAAPKTEDDSESPAVFSRRLTLQSKDNTLQE